MGVGLAVAILLDATLVRAVLLPAAMKLLGERNWYLPRALRWLPKWEHEHGTGAGRTPNLVAPCELACSPGAETAPDSMRSSEPSSARASTPTGTSSWASATAGPACSTTRRCRSPATRTRGILHRGGTILGSSRTNVYKVEDGLNKVKAAMEAPGPRRADPDRRRGHARRRRQAARGRHPGRRRAEDDRQRPRGDRLHVRLPDRGADRHRRDRPPAHHGGVPQPRAGVRGHGPPRRLARRLLRHGRRRRRDPRSRSARSTSTRSCDHLKRRHANGRDVLDRRRRRGRHAQGRRPAHRSTRRRTPSGTCGSAASAIDARAARSRSGRASSRA